MNLHSKEVAIKRPKPPNLDETDLISKLHDSLLLQILSLLPESDAARTRILSNRWKNLCSFLPNLHFVMPFCSNIEQVNKFHDSVDQTLALRGGIPIRMFHLYCSKNCNYNRVHDCLCNVVNCKVQELDIRFPNDRFRFRFCWDLFRTCGSLVRLTLRGGFVLNVPDVDVLFPCLKSISLVSIVYLGDVCFKNLVSRCPVLEELYVERQLIGELDDMQSCKVISPSLKKLRLSFALSGRGHFRVVIDAPRLEYLSVMDVMSTRYSLLTEPLSLTEAHLKVSTYGGDEHVAQLVRCLSNVKVLTLNVPTLRAFINVHNLDMPVFPNLVEFAIGLDVFSSWSMLPGTFFNKMPNVEHITFLMGFLPSLHAQHIYTMRWNPPVEVPTCLRFKMKKITIKNRETITPEELKLIRYMLKHANHLEILTLNAHKIDPKTRGQVLKFYRGSKSCRIEFV